MAGAQPTIVHDLLASALKNHEAKMKQRADELQSGSLAILKPKQNCSATRCNRVLLSSEIKEIKECLCGCGEVVCPACALTYLFPNGICPSCYLDEVDSEDVHNVVDKHLALHVESVRLRGTRSRPRSTPLVA